MHGLRTFFITHNWFGFRLKTESPGFLLLMGPPTPEGGPGVQDCSHGCTAQCSRVHRSLSEGNLELVHPNSTAGPSQITRQLHSGSCSQENPACSHQNFFCTALLSCTGSMESMDKANSSTCAPTAQTFPWS